MAKNTQAPGVIGPMHSSKKIISPKEFPKGVTLEALAKAIGPNNIIKITDIRSGVGPSDITSGVGPTSDASGIELTASSLNRVHVALTTDNDVVLLRCKVCGTQWVPILQEGKRLPSGWWSCPKDEKHSQ